MSKVGLGMVLLGLWTTGVVGCGEGDEPDYVGREAYCDGLCAAAERCGSNPDREWCFDACLSNSETRPALSDQGGVAYGACLSELICAHLGEQWAFDDCWDAAKDQTPVTPGTRDFCEIYTERTFECAYGYSTTECERDYRMWGHDVLERVTSCWELPTCEDREACAELVFQ
jgi:hypothetical protein